MTHRFVSFDRRGKCVTVFLSGFVAALGLLSPDSSEAQTRRRSPSTSEGRSGQGAPSSPPRAPSAAAAPGVPVPVNTVAKSTTESAPMTAPVAASPSSVLAPAPQKAMDESATEGTATVAPVTSTEQAAAALADNAMNRDYRAGRHRDAEKKLRQAIALCLKEGCSAPFRARLNRDIGVVYVGGMGQLEEGKDEFATALTADPTVAIAPEWNTKQVNAAFMDVKRALAAEGQGAPEVAGIKGQGAPEVAGTKGGTSAASASSEQFTESKTESSFRHVMNWITLGFQQDYVLHTSTQNVCNTGSRYTCYDNNNQAVNYDAGVYNGNEISASGLRIASSRVLIGYERLLSKHFGIGFKVGGVVAGKGVILAGTPAFFAFHAEGRLTLYPGSDPFGTTTHFRPYAYASGGVAETDSKILVEVVQSANAPPQRVNAWKRTGKRFAGGGLGIVFPIRQSMGPFIEARFMRMFEKPSYAMAAMGGWAIGF